MFKQTLSALSILLFAVVANAQHTSKEAKEILNYSTQEDCLKTRVDCDTVIFSYVDYNQPEKILKHLELYPHSISYTYQGWYPIQNAVHLQHKEAATALIKYLAGINKLSQIYERGDENGDQALISSAYDLDTNFVEEILSENGFGSQAKH